MPLRAAALPRGPDMQLYRSASFGRLAQFMVLDTRQYRTSQANGGAHGPMTAAALNPKNTMLGAKQKSLAERRPAVARRRRGTCWRSRS